MYVVYTYISDEQEVSGGGRERSNVSVSKKNSRRRKKQILAGEWQMRRTQTN